MFGVRTQMWTYPAFGAEKFSPQTQETQILPSINPDDDRRDTKRHKETQNPNCVTQLISRFYVQETQETQIIYISP